MNNSYTLCFSFVVSPNYLQLHRVQNPYIKASAIIKYLSELQYQVKSHSKLNWDCDHIQQKPHYLTISF